MKFDCNWCHGGCWKPEHEAPHLAQTYLAGPSTRLALIHKRKLLKAATENEIEATGLRTMEVLSKLLAHEVALSHEMRDMTYEPASLTTLPNELQRKILSYVVSIEQISSSEIYDMNIIDYIFGQQKFCPPMKGLIDPARASKALFTAAISTLLEEDTVTTAVFFACVGRRNSLSLTTHRFCISFDGLKQHVRRLVVSFVPHLYARDSYWLPTILERCLKLIPKINQLYPRLSSLFFQAPYLTPLGFWETSNHHMIAKKATLEVLRTLRGLKLRRATLQVPNLPKQDCNAEDFEETFLVAYDAYYTSQV
ncbi:uncharacterized protein RCC_08757 [Ramularia collo-cygni]|uniref:Uncharacterized protein n=1 Tax=Ramularia collo-cygni TaxID=112498 RepID=A0A2D3UYA3_9PEZI|nr:uncharacterized protein RCC_08757 [Ramularia collo-cygni]CZT23047.1 uncharacterized protein RCC_08757 [Ramularia collo-cygni]